MKTLQDEFNFLYKNMPTPLYGNQSWHNGDENNPVYDIGLEYSVRKIQNCERFFY